MCVRPRAHTFVQRFVTCVCVCVKIHLSFYCITFVRHLWCGVQREKPANRPNRGNEKNSVGGRRRGYPINSHSVRLSSLFFIYECHVLFLIGGVKMFIVVVVVVVDFH